MAKIEKNFFYLNLTLVFKKTNSKFKKKKKKTFCYGVELLVLFLGRKSKISKEQNVKEFQFYIHMRNFSFLGSIIKKCLRIADPLNSRFTKYRNLQSLARIEHF